MSARSRARRFRIARRSQAPFPPWRGWIGMSRKDYRIMVLQHARTPAEISRRHEER